MRVIDRGVGIHQRLEDVVGADLADARQQVFIALAQRFGGFRPGLAGQHQRQRVVLDPQAPQFVEFGGIARPRRVLPVEDVALVELPVRLGGQQAHCVMHAFAIAFLELGENQERRLELPGVDHVVEAGAPLLHGGDIGGQEVTALAVEGIEVALEDLDREFLVDPPPAIVGLLEDGGDPGRHQLLARGGMDGAFGQAHAAGGAPRGARRREQQQAGAGQRKRRDQLAQSICES